MPTRWDAVDVSRRTDLLHKSSFRALRTAEKQQLRELEKRHAKWKLERKAAAQKTDRLRPPKNLKSKRVLKKYVGDLKKFFGE